MKITKRQLKRIIREEKQKLREEYGTSGPDDFEELVRIMEGVLVDYMAATGDTRKMGIYNMDLALARLRGRRITRTK